MSSDSSAVTNVIRFPSKRAWSGPDRAPQTLDRKSFLEVVHSCGMLWLNGGDRTERAHAVRFCVLGLVAIDELSSDGSLRRLRPSEAFLNDSGRRWRVCKLSDTSSVSLAPSPSVPDMGPEMNHTGGVVAFRKKTSTTVFEPPPAA